MVKMYEMERSIVGKKYTVVKPWKIAKWEMKKGDKLQVIDWEWGDKASDFRSYLKFKNEHISFPRMFYEETPFFRSHTEEQKEVKNENRDC